jgi:hypothetical protein
MTRKKDPFGRLMSEQELPRFQPPEDADITGDSGVAEVSWRATGDGSIEITAINGVSLDGSMKNTETETEETEDDYA